jgi:hypothetical protein
MKDKKRRIKVTPVTKEREALMEDKEELSAIRAYDDARASGEIPIPYNQVLKKCEQLRK